MQITLFDRSTYKVSQREYTNEGFLRVPGRVARTGIQQYLASELGLDGDPMRIVNVYRPADEVFSQPSLDSYNGSDVTNDHPRDLVNPETFSDVTVGVVVGPGVRDGDFVVAPMIVKDKEAIEVIEGGKAELSAGYTAEYEKTSGVTEDGQEYEFIQRDIRINHVALVDKARAGAMARIFDKQVEAKMAKVTLDNGRAIEVEDAVAAQVEDSIQRLTDSAQTEKDRADGLQAQLDGVTEDLEKAKIAASDESIAAKVKAVSAAVADAQKLAGSEFTCDSVDSVEIKRAALASIKDSVNWAEKSEAYVEAAFDMEMEKKAEDEDEEEDGKKAASDAQAKLAADMAKKQEKKVSPRQSYSDSLTGAWKKTLGEDA